MGRSDRLQSFSYGRRHRWAFLPTIGFLVVVALAFAFFLPVLSAQFPLDPDEFAARIWFDSWR